MFSKVLKLSCEASERKPLAMGAAEIIRECIVTLINKPVATVRLCAPVAGVLVGVVVVKLVLFIVCYRWRSVSSSLRALAFDHFSDMVTNCVALLGAFLAGSPAARHILGTQVQRCRLTLSNPR